MVRDKEELKLFSTKTLEEKLQFLDSLSRFDDSRKYDFSARDIREELKLRQKVK